MDVIECELMGTPEQKFMIMMNERLGEVERRQHELERENKELKDLVQVLRCLPEIHERSVRYRFGVMNRFHDGQWSDDDMPIEVIKARVADAVKVGVEGIPDVLYRVGMFVDAMLLVAQRESGLDYILSVRNDCVHDYYTNVR